MMHKGFIFVLRRELRKMLRYRTFTFAIVVLPIVTFLFLSAVFYRGVPNDLPIAVLDEDNTALSRQAARMVDAGQYVEVAYKVSSLTEAKKMIAKGDIYAVLVLPRDMESNIYGGKQVKAPIFINGVNLLVGSLVQKDVLVTMQSFSAGIEMQKLQSKGVPSQTALVTAMPIYFERHILFNPYTSYAYYLLPGFMPMMLLMFTILSSVFAIGIELKRGTAYKWIGGARGNIFVAVAAKLLPYTAIFLIHSALMNIVMYNFFGVPLNGSIAIIVIANVLFVLAYQMMGVLLITILANMRLAMSIAAGYSVLAFSFSGLTFPFYAMNGYIVALSKIFPFTFYTYVFIDQAMRGAPVAYSLWHLVAMFAFVVVPMLLLPRLKTLAINEKFWGRA